VSEELRAAIEGGDREGALRSAEALLASGGAARVAELAIDLLTGESAWRREGMLELLRSVPPSGDLIEPLVAALGSGQHADRRNAARSALAALATPGARDPAAPLSHLAPVVERHADVDVRILAAHALAESGNPRAREALQAALADPEPNVVAAAAEALGALGDPRAVPALVELAGHDDFWTRSAAIVALGTLGDPGVVPVLALIAADPWLGAVAARALGEIGGPAALEALRASAGMEGEPREEAMRSAARIVADQHEEVVPDWLREVARREEESLVARFEREGELEAARLAGIVGTPRAAAALLDRLAEDEEGVAAAGLRLLPPVLREQSILFRLDVATARELPTLLALLPPLRDESAIQRVADLLRHDSHEVVATAAEALGRADPDAVLARLEGLWRDPEARLGAALAYSRLGSDRCTPLLEMLKDPDAAVRAAAAEGMGRCGLGAAGELRDALRRETEPRVRRALVRALGVEGGPGAVAELRRLIDAEDPALRFEAVKALGCTGSASAFPLLMAALSDPDPGIRTVALSALGDLGDARAEEPLARHIEDPDRDRRRIATVAIGRLFGEDSADRLEAALRDPDREVRLVAVNAFGRLRLPGTAPLLERVAEEDQDSTVRQEAARVAAALQGVAGEVP
jgi:HEAT repeat protein